VVDETHIRRQRIGRTPWGQIVVGQAMRVDYRLPRPTRIALEGVENVPRDRRVLFALNHTDRYNYWPFQYAMWRRGGLPYTAVWIKAKYYRNALLGAFFDLMDGIPLPSRGYLLLLRGQAALGRRLDDREYRALRDLSVGRIGEAAAREAGGEGVARVLGAALAGFDPAGGPWADRLERDLEGAMGAVEDLTLRAMAAGRNVIVFPQGTRSLRLLPARTGIVQFAIRHGVPIVPVGSNGCERVYPGASPFSKGGDVTYRIGRPLEVDDAFADCRPDGPFVPFTRSADRYREPFDRAAARVTEAIDALLDAPYRLDPAAAATRGTDLGRLV